MNKVVLLSVFFLTACGVEITSPEPSGPLAPAPAPEEAFLKLEAEAIPEILYEPALVESLKGLSPGDVIIRMGSPNLVMREELGQIMLFEHATCVFDVVFYAESIESPYRVTHLRSRTIQGQPIDKQLCLTAVKPNGFDNPMVSE